MKRTFVGAGVLIAAARGNNLLARRAMSILDDPNREFASSVFVRLEVLPKPIYQNRRDEVSFYEEFFREVAYWAAPSEAVIEQAHREACAWGLGAIDALHVAAAASTGASELATTEKPERPIHRAQCVKVVTIYASAGAE